MAERGVRRWIVAHPRLSLGTLAVVVLSAVSTTLASLTHRNLGRLELIQSRTEQMSEFEQVRVGLQHRLFEDLGPALPWNHFLVQDLRIQIGQALALGDRLDPDTRSLLEGLDRRLTEGAFVSRATLLDAVDLLGRIIDAESQTRARMLTDIRADAGREFRWMLAGLIGLTALAAVGAWLIPRGLILPLRDLVRSASRTLLEQHQALASAERLAAVGETAAGVAHELRNPMAGVILGIENVRREAEGSALHERLDPLLQELQRMNRILQEYLAAARTAPEPAVPTHLATLVRELLDLLEYQVSSHVHFESHVPENLVCVLPKDRLRQVLLNLLLNAVQSLDSKPGSVVIASALEGERLTLEVRDTGPGFPPDLLRDGVRPFATGRAGGTGLGLVFVQRAMKDLGGSMSLENPPDGGGRVALRFPCVREPTGEGQ